MGEEGVETVIQIDADKLSRSKISFLTGKKWVTRRFVLYSDGTLEEYEDTSLKSKLGILSAIINELSANAMDHYPFGLELYFESGEEKIIFAFDTRDSLRSLRNALLSVICGTWKTIRNIQNLLKLPLNRKIELDILEKTFPPDFPHGILTSQRWPQLYSFTNNQLTAFYECLYHAITEFPHERENLKRQLFYHSERNRIYVLCACQILTNNWQAISFRAKPIPEQSGSLHFHIGLSKPACDPEHQKAFHEEFFPKHVCYTIGGSVWLHDHTLDQRLLRLQTLLQINFIAYNYCEEYNWMFLQSIGILNPNEFMFKDLLDVLLIFLQQELVRDPHLLPHLQHAFYKKVLVIRPAEEIVRAQEAYLKMEKKWKSRYDREKDWEDELEEAEAEVEEILLVEETVEEEREGGYEGENIAASTESIEGGYNNVEGSGLDEVKLLVPEDTSSKKSSPSVYSPSLRKNGYNSPTRKMREERIPLSYHEDSIHFDLRHTFTSEGTWIIEYIVENPRQEQMSGGKLVELFVEKLLVSSTSLMEDYSLTPLDTVMTTKIPFATTALSSPVRIPSSLPVISSALGHEQIRLSQNFLHSILIGGLIPYDFYRDTLQTHYATMHIHEASIQSLLQLTLPVAYHPDSLFQHYWHTIQDSKPLCCFFGEFFLDKVLQELIQSLTLLLKKDSIFGIFLKEIFTKGSIIIQPKLLHAEDACEHIHVPHLPKDHHHSSFLTSITSKGELLIEYLIEDEHESSECLFAAWKAAPSSSEHKVGADLPQHMYIEDVPYVVHRSIFLMQKKCVQLLKKLEAYLDTPTSTSENYQYDYHIEENYDLLKEHHIDPSLFGILFVKRLWEMVLEWLEMDSTKNASSESRNTTFIQRFPLVAKKKTFHIQAFGSITEIAEVKPNGQTGNEYFDIHVTKDGDCIVLYHPSKLFALSK